MKKRHAIAVTCLHLMLLLCIDANASEPNPARKAEQNLSKGPSKVKPSMVKVAASNEKDDDVKPAPECVIQPVMTDEQLSACGAHMKSQ